VTCPADPATLPLEYDLHRRRRKSVGVLVRDDGTIEVRAPLRATLREIEKALDRHRAWLLDRQQEHRARWRRRLGRRFDDGDTIPWLGETLRLSVRESEARSEPVRRDDGLVVTLPAGLDVAGRRTAARDAVGLWLLDQAREIFHDRHVAMSALVGDAAVSVTIKEMSSRWGSCGTTRRMSLNWRLVLAPRDIIDYVLVHELTHIRHPDHSPRFWNAVADACPHWRESREWLRHRGADLEL